MIAALALLFANQANAAEMVIHSASEFIQFSNDVNNYGTSYYYGTTVFLGADIDFNDVTDTFYPIGKSSSYYFEGVFDGQGHTISNLNMKTSNSYAGLFGYSRGSTIKNVVLDDSCNIESTYSNGNVYVGGIVGYAQAYNLDINIENCLSMAEVSYNQYTSSSYSYLGGIAGYVYSASGDYNLTIINCANYGTVVRSSTYYDTYIGGIVGRLYDDSDSRYYSSVINCLNYGSVSVTGSYYSSSSSDLYIGGIIGYSQTNEISNCLSVGKISTTYSTPSSSYIGGIAGRIYGSSSSSIDHCIWLESTGVEDGFGNTFSSTYLTDSYGINDVNETTISEMNAYAKGKYGLNKWALKSSSLSDVGFVIDLSYRITLPYSVILLPTLANTLANRTFYGWYTDKNYDDLFDYDIITQTTLYLRRDEGVIVSFSDSYGYSRFKMYVRYKKPYGPFPDVKRPGYEPEFYTEPDGQGNKVTPETIVPDPSDHTLYVKWVQVNYTATFNFWNGTVTSQEYEYGDYINFPYEMEREYYTFDKWVPSVSYMPARNVTFTPVWDPYPFYVTFSGYDQGYMAMFGYGEKIVYPENPTKTGYTFAGWDNDITIMPAENIVITAQWTPIIYTATFEIGDETPITKSYKYNDLIKYPTKEKEGKKIGYWIPSGITYMPAEDTTFTAVWVNLTYTFTFDYAYKDDDDEEVIEEHEYEYGEEVVYPEDPQRLGYEFVKWDKTVATMPARNVTATAEWKIVDYTVTFYEEDEKTVIESHTLHYKDTIPYPTMTKKNYRFKKWNYTQSKMPAESLAITVEWEKIPTDRVDVSMNGNLDKDGISAIVTEYTDAKFAVTNIKTNGGKTTATIIFDDAALAKEFVETVKDEMAVGIDSRVGPKIECDYNYDGEKKSRRPAYEYTSDAASLVMSALLLLLFAF